MNRLKWVSSLVFHNFWWKLLALVLAVGIWALVATEPELSTFATVRLEYRNMPDNLEMASPPTDSVTLELRGPAGELRAIGDGRGPASVVLDMSRVIPGEHTFAIGRGNVQLARGVHLVRAIPSEVRFDFEPRLIRTVPVKVRFAGEGANGYVPESYAATPGSVVIVGPSDHVARITSVVTDPVNVASAVGTTVFHVDAYVNDPYVRFQSSSQVTVTVNMKKEQ